MTERIIVRKTGRPSNFPRPLEDWSFANSGRFTYARAIDQFLPEDAMHCGALLSYTELLKCSLLELPARHIQVEYELMADTRYAVWRADDKAFGTIIVNTHGIGTVDLSFFEPNADDGQDYTFGLDDWQEQLRALDFIIVPMIWRSGACVSLARPDDDEGHDIACIIPVQNGNFIDNDCSYMVLFNSERPPKRMHFAKVLEALIPVGTEVFVKLESQPHLNIAVGERRRPLLSGRLNAPTVEAPEPGKIYVTCMQKPALARNDVSDISCVTLILDPWDVLLEAEDPTEVVRFLLAA